jgi:hypothetical protein
VLPQTHARGPGPLAEAGGCPALLAPQPPLLWDGDLLQIGPQQLALPPAQLLAGQPHYAYPTTTAAAPPALAHQPGSWILLQLLPQPPLLGLP